MNRVTYAVRKKRASSSGSIQTLTSALGISMVNRQNFTNCNANYKKIENRKWKTENEAKSQKHF